MTEEDTKFEEVLDEVQASVAANWRKPKFLTICEGGNVRSVALAMQIKDAGCEAIAASTRSHSTETFRMLIEWADYVVVMQKEFKERLETLSLLEAVGAKLRVVDVGPDVYHSGTHLGLNKWLQSVVIGWKERDWRI